jgi:hypothetical protein
MNSQKMVIVPFTQKRDLRGLKEPTLSWHTWHLTTEVKYLGLFLDKGLTWKAQLKNVMNKTYRAFWTCKGTWLCFSVTQFYGVVRHDSDYCMLSANTVTVFLHQLLTATVFKQYATSCLPICISDKICSFCMPPSHLPSCQHHKENSMLFQDCALSTMWISPQCKGVDDG